MNMYAYCGNNPVNNIDPTGEFSIAVIAVAVAIQSIMVGVYLRDHNYFKSNPICKKFDNWYKRQMVGWWRFAKLPKCPKKITVINGKPSYNGPDKHEWKKPKKPKGAEERLHPGIAFSMRSKPKYGIGWHSNQATYDKFGNLHTKYPKAGTVDYRPSFGSKHGGMGTAHFHADVEPLHWAVYLDHSVKMYLFWGPKVPEDIPLGGYMEKYFEKRPLY